MINLYVDAFNRIKRLTYLSQATGHKRLVSKKSKHLLHSLSLIIITVWMAGLWICVVLALHVMFIMHVYVTSCNAFGMGIAASHYSLWDWVLAVRYMYTEYVINLWKSPITIESVQCLWDTLSAYFLSWVFCSMLFHYLVYSYKR